jgi:hypothetical protein
MGENPFTHGVSTPSAASPFLSVPSVSSLVSIPAFRINSCHAPSGLCPFWTADPGRCPGLAYHRAFGPRCRVSVAPQFLRRIAHPDDQRVVEHRAVGFRDGREPLRQVRQPRGVELADRNGVLVATRVARVRMADPVLVHGDPEFLPRLVSMRAASSVNAVRPSSSSLPRVSCDSLFVSSTVIVLMESGSSARADAAPGSGFIAQNAREHCGGMVPGHVGETCRAAGQRDQINSRIGSPDGSRCCGLPAWSSMVEFLSMPR